MNLQKRYLELFINVLNSTEPGLAGSRLRDSVLKSITQETEDFFKARTTIYETFCNKDEEGKPDVSDNQYKFKKEVLDEVNKELNTLLDEEIEVKITDADRIKELIESTNYKPKYGEVEIIDEILTKIA